jgi:hypothetical protein
MAWGFDEQVEEVARLQALRAAPPGFAGTDPARREVFGAALQQFEELLSAAAAVGPASAPLPLFYALSQSGRAIAAALCADEQRWDFHGHGLSVIEDRSKIGDTRIVPKPYKDRSDAYSVVSDAVGSPPLTTEVELSRLWASIPQIDRAPGLGADRHAPILLNPSVGAQGLSMVIADVPEKHLPRDQQDDALARRLAHYPDAAGYRARGPVTTGSHGPIGIWLEFADDNGTTLRELETIGEPLFGARQRYLRPALNDAGDLPTTLMSWWALLLALSSLARYVPAGWTKALARDSSPMAVPIEKALRSIRRTLPRQIFYVLTGDWW